MKIKFWFAVIILVVVIFILGCSRNADSNLDINNKPLNFSDDYESDDGCYVQNCHFIKVDDINCDNKIDTERVCTEIFYSSDPCGKFATCGLVENKCIPEDNTRYNDCVNCVNSCSSIKDFVEQENCYGSCY